jgi:hypothetical protein
MPVDNVKLQREIATIRDRWRVVDLKWPWLVKPCTVRILCYADFSGAYDNGPFDGLKHVLATLAADPYYWVRFQVTKASRVNDASADAAFRNKTLDAVNLADYDEVWFFGLERLPSVLSTAEINAMRAFMDKGGGVLVTGDHEDLGAAIASAIPRAGKMRAWSAGAPPVSGPFHHSTLRQGHDPGYVFNDQSDDVPQVIRYRRYPLPWTHWWALRSAPHPVLCGPDGPIDVLPDHMHEGLVTIPTSLPASEWPSKAGFQPQPEAIAWGKIEEPGLAVSGTEFAVLGAYDGHLADVGRIVGDSTWHHWFDINLIGDNGAVIGDTAGFDVPTGAAALKKIEAYFLNVAIWLAPPAKQKCMRNRLLWGTLWRDPLVMLSPKLPVYLIGSFGLDALGKHAPQCTIYRFIWDDLQLTLRHKLFELREANIPHPPLVEECILGAALVPLFEMAQQRGIPDNMSEDEVDRLIEQAMASAVPTGMRAATELANQVVHSAHELFRVMEQDRIESGETAEDL